MGQITVEKNVGGIEGLCVITPAVHGDNRGYFMETYSQRDMEEAGINIVFVQDNQSCSTKGVLRGLHFQKQFPQTKLVRAIKGRVFDVAVDLRKDSKTYGKWYGVELTEENKKQFLIPKGFAHGCLFSGIIEIMKYITGRDLTEVDDVITNTLGTAVDEVIYKLFSAFYRSRPRAWC